MNDDIRPGGTPELYDAQYYACHCGPLPYERNAYWLEFFGKIAEEVVRSLRPKRVLDAGCAIGLLVECLWDRGVEAYGRDISSYAISQARSDIRQYCEVGSIAEPFVGEYDLVTCIEVLEHMPEELGMQAIRSMTAVAPRILFSSSPDDFDEPTHINVKPPIYWLRRFAEAGFAPVVTFDGTFLCHHAMMLERTAEAIDDRLLLGFAEIIRLRLETLKRDKQIVALFGSIKNGERALEAERQQAASLQDQTASLQEQLKHLQSRSQAAESDAAKVRLRAEELAVEGDRLQTEIAARDAVLAGLAREAADLREFKSGVYRNPLFLLVRMTNRLGNALGRSPQGPIPRRSLLKRVFLKYRDTAWARSAVGRARRSLPGRIGWSVLRRSAVVRGVVNRARAAAELPAGLVGEAAPSLPPARRGAAPIGYVPPVGLLPWFNALTIEVVPDLAERPYLNILLPGLGMKYMSGGPNTAVNIGYRLALMGVAVRFISTDVATDQDATEFWRHVRALADTEECAAHVELVDAHDRSVPLAIGANDIFMATAWWTAQMAKYALRHTRHRRFVYLIQDYEPLFHAASTPLALSTETYGLDFIPVINTSLLAEFFAGNGIGRFAEPDFAARSLVFEPAIDTTHFYPVNAAPADAPKRRLLFYARPTNATRNLFEIGVAALQKLIQEGKLDPARWDIVAIGEQFVPVPLGQGLTLTPAPWLDFEGYARLMRESDVLLSMMMSPHPSYPPLEMAACGRPVVTTCFANKNKERLAAISPNIIGCEPTIEAIADGLVAAIRLAETSTEAAAGDIGLPRNWGESLRDILPKLHDALLELMGAPAAGGGRFPGYQRWPLDAYAITRLALLRERSERYTQPDPGLLSLLTPVWNTDPAFIDALAESVFQQDSGPGIEWIIVDNGSDRADTVAALRRVAGHPGVSLARVDQNIGILGALRNCLERASHRYIVPLDSDDLLTPDCVRILTSALKAANYPALAYTDEDKIEDERPRDAYFKPDWDPVLFAHSCYIAHLCAIDREQALALGCYSDPAPQGSHDWDSFVRFHLAGHLPYHVPEIVYSWRMHPDSTSGNFRSKDYIFASQRHVLERFVAGSASLDDYAVAPSPLFPGTPDWRIVPTATRYPAITSILIGPSAAAPSPAWSEELADHRVERLADPGDLAKLRALAERCAAEGRLVHLLADVTVSDSRWPSEAQALLALFPDTVMIGGRVETNQVIVAADGYFGFGDGWDSPNRGRHFNDPGYFVHMWKPHSTNVVPIRHAVLRADFLAEALTDLVATGLTVGALGPWLGAAASRRGKRIVYSPFFAAHSDEGMPLPPAAISRAAFLQAHRDLVPERRLMSPHLGLTRETAYRPVPAAERAAQARAARADPDLAYGDTLAAEVIARLAAGPRPHGTRRFSALTSVYARTPAALFDETAQALLDQSYGLAEWILLENGPIPSDVAAVLDRLERDPRVRRFRVPENLGITGAMRFCLEQATGDYVVPLDADDLLTRDALQQLALGVERSGEPAAIFSDEDVLTDGVLASPFRRPGFDPILNAADSYIFHLCAFRRDRALALGLYSDRAAEFCQDWDALQRFEQAGDRIAHIPLVLYHWRAHSGSISNSGASNEGSRTSTRHVLGTIVARQARPDLYEVQPFPIHRGAEQYAILRRPSAPLPLVLVYRARRAGDAVPAPLLKLAGGAIRGSCVVAAAVPADIGALERLGALAAHALVLQHGYAIDDERAVWEAMRLFEMHDDVGLVGGRVLDTDDRVVASCAPVRDSAGWVGMRRSDPGRFAMALKPQTVTHVPDAVFFCRLDLLRDALREELSGSWADRVTARAHAQSLRLAYSPLIEARQGAPEPATTPAVAALAAQPALAAR